MSLFLTALCVLLGIQQGWIRELEPAFVSRVSFEPMFWNSADAAAT